MGLSETRQERATRDIECELLLYFCRQKGRVELSDTLAGPFQHDDLEVL